MLNRMFVWSCFFWGTWLLWFAGRAHLSVWDRFKTGLCVCAHWTECLCVILFIAWNMCPGSLEDAISACFSLHPRMHVWFCRSKVWIVCEYLQVVCACLCASCVRMSMCKLCVCMSMYMQDRRIWKTHARLDAVHYVHRNSCTIVLSVTPKICAQMDVCVLLIFELTYTSKTCVHRHMHTSNSRNMCA